MHLGLSSEKIVIWGISYFTTFPRILVFSRWKRILQTLQLLRILHGIIIISRISVYSRILVFNPCKWIEQLCSSLLCHGIITTTKLPIKPGLRAVFRKTFTLRNFVFYSFSENLHFQSYEEGCATLLLPLIPRSIITISKIHKKFTCS